MQIRDVMTRNAQLIDPDDTIQDAAKLMAECDCGVLPVADGDRLVGMITDRDLAIRILAEGKGPHAKVRDAMTSEVNIVSRTRTPSMSPKIWRTFRFVGCP
jgi:CBS domain-containing protein